jgi:hypothetical protein
VHEDHIARLGQPPHPGQDRVAALGPTGNHLHGYAVFAAQRLNEVERLIDMAGWCGNHDGSRTGRQSRADGILQQRATTHVDERLGHVRGQPRAGTGGDDDDADAARAASASLTSVEARRRQDARTSSRMDLGLFLVGLLGEGELGDEDLAGLGEHALLAGGQATVLVAAPQVADDLGDLDDVAGGELLEVGLVAARPVGRLLGVGARSTSNTLSSPLGPTTSRTPTRSQLSAGTSMVEVALRDLQLEVQPLHSP